MKYVKYLFSILAFTLFVNYTSYSQSAQGKLQGRVLDAQTKEALIGVNVVIMNTDLGAATDIEGNYFILNIPPGTYTVRFSYVGYSTRVFNDVNIVGGITKEINVELSAGVELQEIVVSDEKFFEEKATNTVRIVDAEDIARLPVRGVENIASLQAGVVKAEGSGGAGGNATLNVRGGRGGEVLYVVDGVAQNDIYTGENYSQVSNSAIEQLTFQIGGYEAKYGQAQSGIINVTTKGGNPQYGLFADVVSSEFTDDYNYNMYTFNISGPIFPGVEKHTMFLSAERGWFGDGDPRAVPVEIPSINYSSPVQPNNSSDIWRFTAKTSHNFGAFSVRLSGNLNTRNFRTYIHQYAKNNSEHNPLTERLNGSISARISQNLSTNSFWNLNLGYRTFRNETGDGVWFDNLEAYGDVEANKTIGVNLLGNGLRLAYDPVGVFFARGRVSNAYSKTENTTLTADLDFTSQIENHLLEIGGGFYYNLLRFYSIAPVGLALEGVRDLPAEERYRQQQPTYFGYDITGRSKTSLGDEAEPRQPIQAYVYIQDRFELEDIVLNVGLRADFLDTKADILRDPTLPYAFGNPNAYDPEDFVVKKAEFELSPRIGLGFPVTENTVFHAQYGRFVQQPSLQNLYTTINNLNFLITDNNWLLNNGHLESEVTTQYEIGFRQVFADAAALNITAFYKNTRGLINTATVFFQRQQGGATLRYITPTNTDFGTIKGLALTLDVARISYFSLSLDYTYALAEGTGSSTNSSFTAAFRNTNGEIPKVIAPLDFDQRHTGVVNFDFFVPKGKLGFLQLISANLLFSFNSGTPYTPLESQNLLAGTTNFGETRGYVNSAYGPGAFRVDLKVEKGFPVGGLIITPYLWVDNVFNADNVVNVYWSTGSAETTGWLNTEEGKKVALEKSNQLGNNNFATDYMALERDPLNFGVPRLIRLGMRLNFSNVGL